MKLLLFDNKYFPNAKRGLGFEQDFSFNHERGLAFVNDGIFFACGIRHGGEVHFLKVENTSFPFLKKWVSESFGDNNPFEIEYDLGTYYKRIWRPIATPVGGFPPNLYIKEKNSSFISLKILLNKLEDLFETIEPDSSNLSAYGHRIREILLLACMEVESSWTAVLRENGYEKKGDFTTKDFAKLQNAMLLDGYELILDSYPDFPLVVPFENWDIEKPTQSLSWYDAYNKVKHNREVNLEYATLKNTVDAVGAAVVMFYAQFSAFPLNYHSQKNSILMGVLKINTRRMDRHEKSFYIPNIKIEGSNTKPIASNEWIPVNFKFN